MSNFMISLIIAVAAGAWIFNRFQKTSGNNTKQSLIAAAAAAAVLFVLSMIVTSMVI